MSYYFAIVGTLDNPLFTYEFGTSKSGGDGIARFREEQRHMNQFIVHASLDIVEEVQWGSGSMYLKHIDRYSSSYIYAFITGANVKFLLLFNPETHAAPRPPSTVASRSSAAQSFTSTSSSSAGFSRGGGITTFNPTAPQTEDAIKNFFLDVYDAWLKTTMNPFYQLNMSVRSPVFRGRVAGAARKYL